MNTNSEIYNKYITAFVSISDYFHKHTNAEGVILCEKHNVEHIGKSAYVIGINDFLYTTTKDKKYLERLLLLTNRLCERFVCSDGEYSLLAGTDPVWNMSSNVIDSGSAIDILSLVLEKYYNYLNEEQVILIKKIITERCDTYLTSAVIEKAHTNQRLWGATGLSNAYSLLKVPEWKTAVLESINKSYEEIRADGSIPYITRYREKGHSSSVNDVSCNYQSRHIAYIWYSLEKIGELIEDHISKLKPAVDFLMALYGEPGKKIMQLETKRWYYVTEYEIASNTFDIYTFAKLYEVTKDEKYAVYGKQALLKFLSHITDNGLSDQKGREINFLCKNVTNAHTLWLTRVSGLISQLDVPIKKQITHPCKIYEPSGIVTFRNDNYAVTLRGSKQPFDSVWGAKIGGGSIVYLGTKDSGFVNKFKHNDSSEIYSGSFYISQFIFNPRKWFTISRRELAALVFHIRVEIHSRNYIALYKRCLRLVTSLIYFHSIYSSASATKVMCTCTEPNVLICDVKLSDKKGEEFGDVALARTYQFLDKEIMVNEHVTISKKVNKITYRLPTVVNNLRIETDGRYKSRGSDIVFINPRSNITISYCLPCV